MANIKTAKKMILVHERRRQRNVSAKSRVKTAVKAVIAAAANAEATAEERAASLKAATSVIEKAASKGIIHKNKAARRTSRLARRINAANAAKA